LGAFRAQNRVWWQQCDIEVILTKIVFTVFHNRASDILRGSKQWWTLASISKISRGSGSSNPSRIDAYVIASYKQVTYSDASIAVGGFLSVPH